MKRIGGFRRKTRHKLSKKKSQKGIISIRRFVHKFKEGEMVLLKAEPAYQKAMYFPRYHGKTGIIKGKQGVCYKVEIKDKNAKKTFIVHPIHLLKR